VGGSWIAAAQAHLAMTVVGGVACFREFGVMAVWLARQ
jgi:hypothetical protein